MKIIRDNRYTMPGLFKMPDEPVVFSRAGQCPGGDDYEKALHDLESARKNLAGKDRSVRDQELLGTISEIINRIKAHYQSYMFSHEELGAVEEQPGKNRKEDMTMNRMLIVDDSEEIRMLIKSYFRRITSNSLILETDKGENALELYKKIVPDIVVLDLMMQDKNGIDVMKEILEYDRHARIIIVTGYDEKELYQSCVRQGAKAFLVKPFNSAFFTSVLKPILAYREEFHTCPHYKQ
ncbi:MAG: response regulator [bacterium]|nr:response regulator [bacterium]